MQESVGATREPSPPRREILKRLVYVAPVILTLAARPSFAQSGSAVVVPD